MRKGMLVLMIMAIIILSWVFWPQRHSSMPSMPDVDKPLPNSIINGNFSEALKGWQITASNVKPQYDIIQLKETLSPALVLVAEQGGFARLSQFVAVDTAYMRFHFKANFLSTRGDGQICISAFDANHQVMAKLGWIVVGALPAGQPNTKWYDLRIPQNYLGDWLEQDLLLAECLAKEFPQLAMNDVRGFQVDFLVADGQHGVLSDVRLTDNRREALSIELLPVQPSQTMGHSFVMNAKITNRDCQPQRDIVVRAIEPFGWGLTLKELSQNIMLLQPGESRNLTWTVTAQRPSLVNLNKPWKMAIQVEGMSKSATTSVDVRDPNPGQIFYVLTDDLEPMDGAGYDKAFGNQNAWLDSEEFEVQLIEKAERLNGIADLYGAKWSHYIAWPAVLGAEWAAAQSATGRWPAVIEKIKQSVRAQSNRGHEYALHLHCDYDPRLPGNILHYNHDADGFWGNHRRHGWAHNVSELGDFQELVSLTGTLYDYHARLTELMRHSSQGQIIATRTGSFDFGDTPEAETKSFEAYRRAGLWAGSDAGGNLGGVTTAPFEQSLYLTTPDDINKQAENLAEIGLLQFLPNPSRYIAYDMDKAAVLNAKVTEGVQAYIQQGQIIPGIHAIVGFTHAMFIMGDGDWRSLKGGQFAEIDKHLAFVKEHYVNTGLVGFATSSELAKNYWDYFTPVLRAVYGEEQGQGRGQYVYPIRLIGSQIPVDSQHVHNVTLKYPLYLRDQAYKIEVRKNGQNIVKTHGLPTPFNDIIFPVDDADAHYTLHIYTNSVMGKLVKIARWGWDKLLIVRGTIF